MSERSIAVELVAFDFDGVLCDSVRVKTEAFRELYARHGDEVARAVVDHHRRHRGVERREKIRHYEIALLGRSGRSEEVEAKAERFSQLVTDKVIASPLIPGARSCLERLAEEIPLYVVSATPQVELEHIACQKGLAAYFQEILGSPVGKAEHLSRILDEGDTAAARALMVGDAWADHQAADAVGTGFIGIAGRDGDHPFSPGTRVVPDLEELYRVLVTEGRLGPEGIGRRGR